MEFSRIGYRYIVGPRLFNVRCINDLNFSLFNSLPWGSMLMTLPPTHPIQTFQHWNCLLTKILRISHPGLLQIICPSGHPLFSSFTVECVSWYWVGRIEKKKNHKTSRNSRPWYPRTMLKINIHIFGLTKCTIYYKKCSCICSCFPLCIPLRSFFRLKELFQVKKSVTTSFLFFFLFLKMPKIWVVRTTVNREKKRGWTQQVYAKVGALRRLRKLVPADISLMLYKAYILPHLEYCSPLL